MFKSNDYPEVYKALKVDPNDLGCVMLNTQALIVSDVIPNDALYYKEGDTSSHTMGNVAETEPHLTLLYGLLQSGQVWRDQIDTVLDGWTADNITIDHVDFFYSSDPKYDYIAIIAKVQVTSNLLEAHARLSLLPHINTFPTYQPHITLAYVKPTSEWKGFINKLNTKYAGQSVAFESLNYGE